jgi:molybdenum cofactor synthesis domain-containing protein
MGSLEPATVNAAVVVCSDRAFSGTYEDQSGPSAVGWLTGKGFNVAGSIVIPDDRSALVAQIESLIVEKDLIVISGGTGLGPKDLTPQVLEEISDYDVPGIGELLRRESLKYSLNAYLSRCGGWVKNQKLLLALPGNPKAVVEQLGILEDILPAAIDALRGQCKHRRRQSD